MITLQSGIDEARAYKAALVWVHKTDLSGYNDIEELLADCPIFAPEAMIRGIVEEMMCQTCSRPAVLDGFCEDCYNAIAAPEPLCAVCGEALAAVDVEAGETVCPDCAAEESTWISGVGGYQPLFCLSPSG